MEGAQGADRNGVEAMANLYDDVNGAIIGGDYGRAWVTYCGRKQGPACYPCNEAEAYQMCNEIKEKIKVDCGDAFAMIYRNADGWMFNFEGI
jgi:hypothetical protein